MGESGSASISLFKVEKRNRNHLEVVSRPWLDAVPVYLFPKPQRFTEEVSPAFWIGYETTDLFGATFVRPQLTGLRMVAAGTKPVTVAEDNASWRVRNFANYQEGQSVCGHLLLARRRGVGYLRRLWPRPLAWHSLL
jgi:hypothetical protein